MPRSRHNHEEISLFFHSKFTTKQKKSPDVTNPIFILPPSEQGLKVDWKPCLVTEASQAARLLLVTQSLPSRQHRNSPNDCQSVFNFQSVKLGTIQKFSGRFDGGFPPVLRRLVTLRRQGRSCLLSVPCPRVHYLTTALSKCGGIKKYPIKGKFKKLSLYK